MQVNTYVVEDNFDFWNELNIQLDESTIDCDTICLITKEPLTSNYIQLPCDHKFNYTPLCKEIISMKYSKSKYSKNIKLTKKQSFCPYCRGVFNKLLPFIPIYNISLPKYICSKKNCFEMQSCSYKLKSGKHKGCLCGNKNGFETEKGILCLKHYNTITQIKEEVTFVNDDAQTLYKSKTVSQLKNDLRVLNLSITGRKHTLANRIINSYKNT